MLLTKSHMKNYRAKVNDPTVSVPPYLFSDKNQFILSSIKATIFCSSDRSGTSLLNTLTWAET